MLSGSWYGYVGRKTIWLWDIVLTETIAGCRSHTTSTTGVARVLFVVALSAGKQLDVQLMANIHLSYRSCGSLLVTLPCRRRQFFSVSNCVGVVLIAVITEYKITFSPWTTTSYCPTANYVPNRLVRLHSCIFDSLISGGISQASSNAVLSDYSEYEYMCQCHTGAVVHRWKRVSILNTSGDLNNAERISNSTVFDGSQSNERCAEL